MPGKRCSVCKRMKPVSEFLAEKAQCKPCRSSYAAELYSRTHPEHQSARRKGLCPTDSYMRGPFGLRLMRGSRIMGLT
jgi:hypothetical protein